MNPRRQAAQRHLPLLVWLLVCSPAYAGPPYVTDDPEPTRTGGWENYLYLTGTGAPGGETGQAGVELNYGAAPDLQLSLMLPLDYNVHTVPRAGAQDIGAGVKYRFLHASDADWLPDVAAFPAITLPTGARAFSSGHASLFLPVWTEKDFGRWSVFGGGGLQFTPGTGQRCAALAGLALTRGFGRRLTLGVELYHRTPVVPGGPAQTNLGLGAVYQMARHWAVMGSGGPGLETPSRAGASFLYVSLQFTD